MLHAWHSWVLRELDLFKSKFRGAAATLLGAGDCRGFSLGAPLCVRMCAPAAQRQCKQHVSPHHPRSCSCAGLGGLGGRACPRGRHDEQPVAAKPHCWPGLGCRARVPAPCLTWRHASNVAPLWAPAAPGCRGPPNAARIPCPPQAWRTRFTRGPSACGCRWPCSWTQTAPSPLSCRCPAQRATSARCASAQGRRREGCERQGICPTCAAAGAHGLPSWQQQSCPVWLSQVAVCLSEWCWLQAATALYICSNDLLCSLPRSVSYLPTFSAGAACTVPTELLRSPSFPASPSLCSLLTASRGWSFPRTCGRRPRPSTGSRSPATRKWTPPCRRVRPGPCVGCAAGCCHGRSWHGPGMWLRTALVAPARQLQAVDARRRTTACRGQGLDPFA